MVAVAFVAFIGRFRERASRELEASFLAALMLTFVRGGTATNAFGRSLDLLHEQLHKKTMPLTLLEVPCGRW